MDKPRLRRLKSFDIGKRIEVSDGMHYPWLWVLWGKGLGSHTSIHRGVVSFDQRWQLRVNIRGYFVALVFRRREGKRP